jgi:hypothetical protein
LVPEQKSGQWNSWWKLVPPMPCWAQRHPVP